MTGLIPDPGAAAQVIVLSTTKVVSYCPNTHLDLGNSTKVDVCSKYSLFMIRLPAVKCCLNLRKFWKPFGDDLEMNCKTTNLFRKRMWNMLLFYVPT